MYVYKDITNTPSTEQKKTKNAAFATVCFVAIVQRNGKKRIQKMGIKSFRYIESKIGDPLF